MNALSVRNRGIPGNCEWQRKWKFLPIAQHLLLVWYRTIELWMPAKWWWREKMGWGVGRTEAETGKDGLGHATKVLYTTPARCHFIETSW